MKSLTDAYPLKNGVDIPCVGFGTWQTPSGEVAFKAVSQALKDGYRHIDTAAVYGNEKSVGEALKQSGIEREKVFITSKLWNSQQGYDSALTAFDKTMNDLSLEYLDLYLIHWPVAKDHRDDWQRINSQSWKAFEKLYKDKRIRAIGVSNFKPRHLEPLLDTAQIAPMINQIELHPGVLQEETVSFCRERDILIEAWAPLGTGQMLQVETILEIAARYDKSAAQICIRWSLQHGFLPLPKSVTPSRIKENTQVFDFQISQEDMEKIDALKNIGGSGLDPDNIDF